MNSKRFKVVIGRAERIDIPDAHIFGAPAKIDTGAYRSSIWATDVREEDGVLHYKLLGPASEWYSGHECSTKKFETVEVENSFGHSEKRYSIMLKTKLGPKVTISNFTLSERGHKTYPILIGRKLLKNRYIVDVSTGEPLVDEEVLAK